MGSRFKSEGVHHDIHPRGESASRRSRLPLRVRPGSGRIVFAGWSDPSPQDRPRPVGSRRTTGCRMAGGHDGRGVA
ncbi:hypothetical protein ACFSM7_04205 [Clavibacter michiganensis subsp. tessellarius]|uniref:hypothetical protein n=1 Tax=Clavibacter tessellarius TaxID=31965 RepID=UPI00362BE863